MSYLGFSTKISGGLNLLRKMPDARLRIESAVSDIKPLAARMLTDFDISGGLKVAADITATKVQIDWLIERVQTIVRPLKKFLNTKCDFFYDGSVPHPTGKPSSSP